MTRFPVYDLATMLPRAWITVEGTDLVTRDLDGIELARTPVPPRLTPQETSAAVALALDAISRQADITADATALADVLTTATAAGAAHLPAPPLQEPTP